MSTVIDNMRSLFEVCIKYKENKSLILDQFT
jgi:hypothetical protein